MSGYRDYVFKAGKNRLNKEIQNSSIDHAKDIIDSIVFNSDKVINIFTNQLRKDLYNTKKFIDYVFTFLFNNADKNAKLRFIVRDKIENLNDYELVKDLKKYKFLEEKNERNFFGFEKNEKYFPCEFYILNEGNNKTYEKYTSFQTGDDCMYRNEYDGEMVFANANFNDKERSKELNYVFENMIKESKKIKI
jgi:Zn-finger protein